MRTAKEVISLFEIKKKNKSWPSVRFLNIKMVETFRVKTDRGHASFRVIKFEII